VNQINTIYQTAINLLQKAINIFSCLLIVLDVVFIFIEVLSRMFLGNSQAVLEEFPRLLLPFLVFPMMGVLLRKKQHITVELLPENLEGRKRSLLMVVVYAIVLALSVQFLLAGVSTVRYLYSIGFETQGEVAIKNWIIYLPFPIGFAVLGLFAADLMVRELSRLRPSRTEVTA